MNNKYIFLSLVLLIIVNPLFSQAKKPTIMVVPSINWCEQNGYTYEYNVQGRTQIAPDYDLALAKSTELKLVIAKIAGLMGERGFPLKDLESTLQSIKNIAAEDMVTSSRSGAEIQESPLDQLKRVARADIIMELTWNVNNRGPFKSVSFILRGLDAYTNKQIAESVGTGPENGSATVPVLLETAVLAHIDNFNSRLQAFFDDMFENGREVALRIAVFDSFGEDLESEFNGDILSQVIEDWVYDNTIQGRFSLLDATENFMMFEQVRIPLFENERAIDTRTWARGLSTYLRKDYSIDSKIVMRGLGQATIIIGER
ncbi:MAG: DUF6175 family protein [Petrimonas sp.]|jgi:hypothetical protein|nr:DUF6175 family protein [Petrimonas sp.]MDD3542749.1 DUF6175 family protein [Petrimonas sp.]